MKTWLFAWTGFATLLLAASYTVPAAAGSPLAPAQRPRLASVAFTDIAGAPQTLASRQGRVVVVAVWATTCLPCIKQMAALDRLQDKLGAQGLEVVALAQDKGGPAAVKAFLQQQGLPHLKIYVDAGGQAARALGARGMPTSIVADVRGREAFRAEGVVNWDDARVTELLRTLLGGG